MTLEVKKYRTILACFVISILLVGYGLSVLKIGIDLEDEIPGFDWAKNLDDFLADLNGFKIVGTEGGDVPEAVYEALYASMDFYKWREDAVKKIILIGDAEPHPTPRRSGKYSKELIEKTAREKNISVTAIITPDDKSRRGR